MVFLGGRWVLFFVLLVSESVCVDLDGGLLGADLFGFACARRFVS